MTKITESLKILAGFSTIILIIAGTLAAMYAPERPVEKEEPVYEIRNYHIAPDQFEAYHHWIKTEGLPHIRKHMEVVGFWVDAAGIESELQGVEMDELGAPNVTWVVKWESMEARGEGMAASFATPEWETIFAKFPGGREAYLRTEVRFFTGL